MRAGPEVLHFVVQTRAQTVPTAGVVNWWPASASALRPPPCAVPATLPTASWPAACDTSTSLIVAGCTLACSSPADCPQRAQGMAPWSCDGLCRRPSSGATAIYGPLEGGWSPAQYACNIALQVVNVCGDGPAHQLRLVHHSGAATRQLRVTGDDGRQPRRRLRRLVPLRRCLSPRPPVRRVGLAWRQQSHRFCVCPRWAAVRSARHARRTPIASSATAIARPAAARETAARMASAPVAPAVRAAVAPASRAYRLDAAS